MTMSVLGDTAATAFLLEITLKSLLVAAAALLLTWFMRRSSAAQRHLYLSVAVIVLLLLPVASIVLPTWNVDLLPDPFARSRETLRSAPAPATTAPSTTPGGTTTPTTAPSTTEPATEAPAPRTTPTTPPGTTAPRPSPAESGPGTGAKAGEDRPQSAGTAKGGGWTPYRWLLAIWTAGTAVLLGRLLGGKLYGYWIAKRAPELENERVLDAVRRASQKVEYAREVRVAESDHLRVPFVCGLFRPGLIVPSQLKEWSSERIEAILHHEFAHIKRKDILLQFFAQLACCLYWINPLAWVMERKLFIERERACDDVAINRDIKASDYAAYLMEVMEELGDRRTHAWVMSAMAEGTDFKDRIISVLDPVAKRTVPRTGHRAAVVLLSALLLLPVSSLRPWDVVEPAAGGRSAENLELETGLRTDADARSNDADERSNEAGASRTDDGAFLAERGGDADADAPGMGPYERTARRRGDRQTDALIALLDDPDAKVREHAATALGETGGKRAVAALIDALQDRHPKVREHVATALGRIGDSRAVLPLAATVTEDRDARVREHAATALGDIGDERALPSLIEAAREDPEPRVREHAAIAIGMVGGGGAYEVLNKVYDDDRDVRVRAHGAYGLGLLKDERAFDLLVEGLDSKHEEIRANCAEALGLLGDHRAVPHLKKLLRDSSPKVRERAQHALEKLGE